MPIPQNDQTHSNNSSACLNILWKKNVKNKLPNKDTIIDYLFNEWITSKFSKSQESTDRSQSANIYES